MSVETATSRCGDGWSSAGGSAYSGADMTSTAAAVADPGAGSGARVDAPFSDGASVAMVSGASARLHRWRGVWSLSHQGSW